MPSSMRRHAIATRRLGPGWIGAPSTAARDEASISRASGSGSGGGGDGGVGRIGGGKGGGGGGAGSSSDRATPIVAPSEIAFSAPRTKIPTVSSVADDGVAAP